MNKAKSYSNPVLRTLLPLLFMFFAAGIPTNVFAQIQTSPVDGMKDNTPAVHAFTNATIVTSPGRVIQNGTLVIRDGVIEAAGRNVRIPADARVWDMGW